MRDDIRVRELSRRSDFGDRLRACRLRRGLNMPALARILGVAKSSITNWETGVSAPSQAMVPRLCEALGITPNALYGYPENADGLPEEERRALRLYRALSPLDRRNALSFMETMRVHAADDLRERCMARFRTLPRLCDKVCAGSGSELLADGACESCFLLDCRETREADVVVTVTGNSMEPTSQDGQDLLVRYTPSLFPGEIGIFVVDGQGTVKEYRRDGLYPHNPAHSAILPGEGVAIRCVGRVIGAVSQAMRPGRQELDVLTALRASGELA